MDTETLSLLEQIGPMTYRPMFGGVGVFHNGVMFALFVNNKLHLRVSDQNRDKFAALGFLPHSYITRTNSVVSNYHRLTEEFYSDAEKLVTLSRSVYLDTVADKHQRSNKICRIKDLPNLKLSTERMLRKAGIDSIESLRRCGAVEAFRLLQQANDFEIDIGLLWALEGALSGVHKNVICESRRQELLSRLN